MLREMQKWFPRLLLIPSPPSSFNQTVNHLTVSYGFIEVPNCNVKVQGFINRVQDRLHSNVLSVYQSCLCLVLEAKMNGCWKNLLVTHRRFILNVQNLEAITNIAWSHLAFCHVLI